MIPCTSAQNERRTWSASRIARLGFLIGRGFDAGTVAADPLIASSPGNIRRQARRFTLAFREAHGPALPKTVERRLDEAARRRAIGRDGLVRALILAAGSDPGLIDNILDDGV